MIPCQEGFEKLDTFQDLYFNSKRTNVSNSANVLERSLRYTNPKARKYSQASAKNNRKVSYSNIATRQGNW